jgi:hypothetical protein
MTDTIERTTAEDGAEILPGTLCWVMTGGDAPTTVRNSRCLAVYTQGVGSNRWLLLVPVGDQPHHGTHGWVLRSTITERTMTRLNVTRFAETHRGWWAGRTVTFVETCIGHWCVAHQAFHATEECPMPDQIRPVSDEPDRFIENARIAQLQLDLAEARRANEVLVREHEAFIVKASEILGEEADSRDLCEVYDRIAERAGLRRRVREHEVLVEVTYRQRIRVEARSASVAEDYVTDAPVESGWYPDCPLDMGLEDHQQPTDVTVKVIVEPPF